MKKIAHVSISYRYYRKKVNFPVKYYVAKRFKDSANKMKKKKIIANRDKLRFIIDRRYFSPRRRIAKVVATAAKRAHHIHQEVDAAAPRRRGSIAAAAGERTARVLLLAGGRCAAAAVIVVQTSSARCRCDYRCRRRFPASCFRFRLHCRRCC